MIVILCCWRRPNKRFGDLMSATPSCVPSLFSLGFHIAVVTLVLASLVSVDIAWAGKLMLPHQMRDLSKRKQILRSRLPKDDLNVIVRMVSEDIDRSDCLESDKSLERRRIVRDFRIDRIQLTPDDKIQYIIEGWGPCVCGTTGNCPVWVLEKRVEGFKVLLSNGGYGGFNGFSIEATSTNGYNDIILRSHDSASSYDLYVYRFSKTGYKLFQCSFVDYWRSDMTGKRSAPEITKQKCK